MDQSKTKDLERFLNQELIDFPKNAKLDTKGKLEVDYNLLPPGIITSEDYIAVLIDGTFHLEGEEHEVGHLDHFNEIPIFQPQGKLVQIVVSDYVLNTVIHSIIELNWYSYSIHQNSDAIDAFIQGFEAAFGEAEVVNINC